MHINCDHFIVLLELHLKSTAAVFDEHFYVQKYVICIGSTVAPILSVSHFSTIDKRTSVALERINAVKVFPLCGWFFGYFMGIYSELYETCGCRNC